MIKYYIIQGEIEEIRPVERYDYTFKNIIVGGKYIHMAKGATWTRDDTQVGDKVAVTCFDNSNTDENGVPYITGIAVTWLGGKRMATNSDRIRQMTDEQLAEFLASLMPQFCASCRLMDPDFIPMFYCMGKDCEDGWLDWLKDYDRHFWKGREPLKDDGNILGGEK